MQTQLVTDSNLLKDAYRNWLGDYEKYLASRNYGKYMAIKDYLFSQGMELTLEEIKKLGAMCKAYCVAHNIRVLSEVDLNGEKIRGRYPAGVINHITIEYLSAHKASEVRSTHEN